MLAAFTRLRALTLRETRASPDVLRAAELPSSLTDITLDGARASSAGLPWFVGLDQLRNLQRLTFAAYQCWRLGSWDDDTEQVGPLQLPPCLRARTIAAVSSAPHASGTVPMFVEFLKPSSAYAMPTQTVALPVSCKPCTALMQITASSRRCRLLKAPALLPQTLRVRCWGIEAPFIGADGQCPGSDDASAEGRHRRDRQPRALLQGPAAVTLELCATLWLNLELEYTALCSPGAQWHSKCTDAVFAVRHSVCFDQA